MLPSLFAALATMRTVDLSATKGFGGWDSTGNASSSSWREYLLAVDQDTPSLRTHGWRQKLIEAPGGDVLFRRGHAKLAELTGNYIESTRTEFIFEQSGRVPVRENFETVKFKREELEGGGVRYTTMGMPLIQFVRRVWWNSTDNQARVVIWPADALQGGKVVSDTSDPWSQQVDADFTTDGTWENNAAFLRENFGLTYTTRERMSRDRYVELSQ